MPDYLRLVLALIAVPLIVIQVRKPTRGIGRLFLWGMNRSHSSLTDWGLGHVDIQRNATILDVGCGGGRTIGKLAGLATEGRLYGIDYSAESVAVSRMTNKELIKAGRADIRQASVSHLPFPDNQFDLVTAIETHYYWPNLVGDLQEIRRVLKPGATLVIIAESYKGGRYDKVQQIVMKPLGCAHLTVDEHRELFLAAGFSDVQIVEERKRGWICSLGKKPRSN
jgi:SAM-dependent methyltransferase